MIQTEINVNLADIPGKFLSSRNFFTLRGIARDCVEKIF